MTVEADYSTARRSHPPTLLRELALEEIETAADFEAALRRIERRVFASPHLASALVELYRPRLVRWLADDARREQERNARREPGVRGQSTGAGIGQPSRAPRENAATAAGAAIACVPQGRTPGAAPTDAPEGAGAGQCTIANSLSSAARPEAIAAAEAVDGEAKPWKPEGRSEPASPAEIASGDAAEGVNGDVPEGHMLGAPSAPVSGGGAMAEMPDGRRCGAPPPAPPALPGLRAAMARLGPELGLMAVRVAEIGRPFGDLFGAELAALGTRNLARSRIYAWAAAIVPEHGRARDFIDEAALARAVRAETALDPKLILGGK